MALFGPSATPIGVKKLHFVSLVAVSFGSPKDLQTVLTLPLLVALNALPYFLKNPLPSIPLNSVT